VGLGRDYTIYSLIDGVVKFEKFGPDRKKVMSAWTHTLSLSFSFTFYSLIDSVVKFEEFGPDRKKVMNACKPGQTYTRTLCM
jgi:ribosomal protein L27